MIILNVACLVCCGVGTFAGKPFTAGIDDLVRLRNGFSKHDGVIEYGDIRQTLLRVDEDEDGDLEATESAKDSVPVSNKDYRVFDINDDGIINILDAELTFFYYMVDKGNDWDLGEYLEFVTTREETTGDEITTPAFVKAEANFRVSDIDDNDLVTLKEYKSDFRAADYNQDGILTGLELNGFRPTRNVPISNFCADPCNGCTFQDFQPLFKQADADSNGQLSLTEYVYTFRKLINNGSDEPAEPLSC